jgi:two-component sensor histidine kinase
VTGPAVFLQPKAAQVLALAFHELIANAIEHGALAPRVDGQITVSWQVESGPLVALDWKETGSMRVVEPSHQGFGTLVLSQMLGYELKADAKIKFEPDGLRYTIRLPLSDHIGRVQASPNLDE